MKKPLFCFFSNLIPSSKILRILAFKKKQMFYLLIIVILQRGDCPWGIPTRSVNLRWNSLLCS
ncbi:putative LRR receptor-like serine/threonine-protein kinase [Gossypium australe]|uniref:Putative LRR receptor-like serine/threonine-protein kinase n=1 Tax=Gossypium australe TaxID=47621 RepID=A0A5B6U4Q0_9ROSI|nr:putative LRR receptor-like serine/threonine-protein kinase [Gossypium australe]KAA3475611.1 putative LRR receptor-like serine/threonine-protein kinase [Gossypium australe]